MLGAAELGKGELSVGIEEFVFKLGHKVPLVM